MKKLVSFLLLASTFLPSESFGQFKFGPSAGLNIATYKFSSSDLSPKSIYGFNAGLMGEYAINDASSIETVASIMNKGCKMEEIENNVKVTVTSSLYYLDFSISAKSYLNDGNPRIFAVAGPYVGVGLFGDIKGEASNNGIGIGVNKDIEWGSDIRRFDWGLTGGVGIDINNFQIGGKYGFGIMDIGETNNRVISISVAYLLGGDNKTLSKGHYRKRYRR